MKIVSYNINGVRASAKLGLINWVAGHDADVYCFQEVRANEEIVKEIFEQKSQMSFFDAAEPLQNYTKIYNCGNVAGYAGTLVLSKKAPDRVIRGMGEFWQDDEGRTTTIVLGDIAIVNSYVPNGNSRLEFKMNYLAALTKFLDFLRKDYKVIVVGDFNIAHTPQDISHPKELSRRSVFLPEEREALTKIIEQGMIDSFRALNPEVVKYSWRSYRSALPQSEVNFRASWQFRIDYVLVDSRLKNNIAEADILDVNYSDHLPVFCTINL